MIKRTMLYTAVAASMMFSVAASASGTLSRAPLQDVVYLAEIASVRHQAETGDATAQFILGNRFYRGDRRFRLAQSYDDAWHWYLKSARQGHSGAAHNLGVMRLQGNGVQRDLIEALAWFRIAASHGHKNSKDLIPELEALLKPEHHRAADMLKTELVPSVVNQTAHRS